MNPASASLPPVAPAPVRHRLAWGGGLLVLLAVLLIWSWDRGEPTVGQPTDAERTAAAWRALADPQVQADPGRRAAAAAQAMDLLSRDLASRDAIDRVVRVQELSSRHAVALRLEPADPGTLETAGSTGVGAARAVDGGRRWVVAIARAEGPPGPADLVVLDLPRPVSAPGVGADAPDDSAQGRHAGALVLAGVLAGLLLVWRLNRTSRRPDSVVRPPVSPRVAADRLPPPSPEVVPGPMVEALMPASGDSEKEVPAPDRARAARSVIAPAARARASAAGWSAAWAPLAAPVVAPTAAATVAEVVANTMAPTAPTAPTAETASRADADARDVRSVVPSDLVDPAAMMAACLDLAAEAAAPPDRSVRRDDALIGSSAVPRDDISPAAHAEPVGEPALRPGRELPARAIADRASDALLRLLDLESPDDEAEPEVEPDLTPIDIAGLLRHEVEGWTRRGARDGRAATLSPPIVPELDLEPGVVLPAAADQRLLPLAVRALLQQAAARAHAHVTVGALADEGAMRVWVDDDGGAVWRDTDSGFGLGGVAGGVGRPSVRDPDRLGLPLAVAHRVARWHGGEITLGDSPLGGRRVVLRWPLGLQDWGDLGPGVVD